MRRRRLARELARLREERGMTIRQAAGALEWDPSKLSRVEGLQRGIIVRDVRRLLDLYQVTGDAGREALFELARQAKQRGWWQAYADVLPSEYADLIGLEAEAAEIRTYQPELIHGLLQTADYARAVIRAGRPGDTAADVGRRVELRMTRQQILDRDDPPRLRVIVNEAAVRRVTGGPDVMRAQLAALAAERERSNVTVQVLPFTAGEHPAMACGPFVLLGLPPGRGPRRGQRRESHRLAAARRPGGFPAVRPDVRFPAGRCPRTAGIQGYADRASRADLTRSPSPARGGAR